MWADYGRYLESMGGAAYRDRVFAYIEKEDTPTSLTHQIDLLRRVGFASVDVLHKHSCFAAFGGIKACQKNPSPISVSGEPGGLGPTFRNVTVKDLRGEFTVTELRVRT